MIDATNSSKPLVFLDPPQYPLVHCQATGRMQHKNNQYSLYAPADQDVLYEALALRCHSKDRLLHKKFFTAENYSSWPQIRLSEGLNLKDFLTTPPPSARVTRRVVALDCEMVGVGFGSPENKRERSELAQLCAVDVLTGEVLIDKLVLPKERVVDWRTRFSGVSYPGILAAERNGRLLRGWRAARAELLNYIDGETIIVGHDLQNDLHVLRLAHGRIIDTTFQTAEAIYGDVKRFGRTWGLKDLAKVLTDLSIQVGKKGHDCVEDTLATREIALWCICFPAELATWSSRMRVELEKQFVQREKRLEEARKKREAEEAEGQDEVDN